MIVGQTLRYEVEALEVVAKTPDVRVSVFTLGPGHFVPWHYHTRITDTFFCLEGALVVRTGAGDEDFTLAPGQSCAVPPHRPHHVSGEGGARCRFLLVQGVGGYDAIPVEAPAGERAL
jgi:quercetin dioxygenase-like cupin family protein